MGIRDKMKSDLTAAMKARQRDETNVLRAVLGAIDNAEAVPINTPVETDQGRAKDVPRKLLSAEEIQIIVAREISERREKAAQYQTLEKTAEAERLQRESAILEKYCMEEAS